MAEWWEADEAVSEEPAAGGGGEWWADDEVVAEEPAAPVEEPGFLDKALGAGEAGLAIASSAIAEPVAGIAGLASSAIQGDLAAGADTVEATRDMFTYEPGSATGQDYIENVAGVLEPVAEVIQSAEEGLGDATLEATGSPALATVAHSVPTMAMEVIGLGILKRPSQAAQAAAAAQRRVRVDPEVTPQTLAKEIAEPEERSYAEITADLRSGKKGEVAKDVRPDQEILAAAEELGVDLNPSHYSTNEAFKAVEQAVLKSQDSELSAREVRAIKEVGARADEMISEFGGTTDRSLLEAQVRTRFDDNIKALSDQARNLYRQVNAGIKPAQKVNPKGSIAYIEQRLADMGGDLSGLSTAERQLHAVLNGDRPPTYARFDQLRKDIGSGYQRTGPFKDDASANLDAVYKVLSQDQQGVADILGLGKIYAAGRKSVQKRKQIEEQAQVLFGRDLGKSFIPKLTGSATALTKGDVQKFRGLMNALPPSLRQTAATTMLNDLFTMGSRSKGASIGQGFANAYEALGRNAGAKNELFKHLPEEARNRFDAIGKVSTGIYRAKALENTSKTAVAILQALETGGMVNRVLDATSDRVIAGGAYVPGFRAASAGASVAKSGLKSAFDKKKAADDMLSSASFNRAVNKAMEGKEKEANIMLNRSKAWQRFRNTVGEGTRAQIAVQGPIAWLTQPTEEEAPAIGQ